MIGYRWSLVLNTTTVKEGESVMFALHSSAGLYNNKNFIVGGEDDMDAQIWRHS